jgi:hypothetical protein
MKLCGTENMTLHKTKNITDNFSKTWNNEHLRAMITARLRTRPVAHGGLSPPPTMAVDTQRTTTHRTKMIT